jgi:hypothetical protein
MAISLTQVTSKGSSGSVTTDTKAFTSNITAGGFIVVVTASGVATGNNVSSITDTLSNTYTRVFSEVGGAGTRPDLEVWYAQNSPAGANTITVNQTSAKLCWVQAEYAGIAALLDLAPDKNAHTSGSAATADSGSTATTTKADELLIGAIGVASASWTISSAGTNYGNLTQVSSTGAGANYTVGFEDRIVAATGAYNATFAISGSGTWECGVATFNGYTFTPRVTFIENARRLG